METTPKYGLQKPGANDFADISVLNANSDKVDAALDGLERGKETPQGAQAKANAAKSEAVAAAATDATAKAEAAKTAAATDATAKADAAREAAKAASVPLAQKGVAGGVATLTSAGVLPLAQVPDEAKEQRVVANIAARDAIGKKFVGLSVYVKDATADPTVKRGGAYYLWDGAWNKTAEAESMDVNLTWDNVEGKPAVFPPASHTHTVGDVSGLTAELAGKAKLLSPVTVTVPLSWSGSGPWTQTISVAGIVAGMTNIDITWTKVTDAAAAKLRDKAMGCVTDAETVAGGILLTCLYKKPDTAFQIYLKGAV